MQFAPMTAMVSFRVEVPKLEALTKFADEHGISRAGLIRLVVERFVRDHVESGAGAALTDADRMRLMCEAASPARKRREPVPTTDKGVAA